MNGFLKSLSYAVTGLWYVLRKERNARIHLVVAVIALLGGLVLGLSNAELAAVFFAIILVFLAEIINTAFEKMLDIIEPTVHPGVKIIKDMSAGAVLVAAGGALLIGSMIYVPYVARLVLR